MPLTRSKSSFLASLDPNEKIGNEEAPVSWQVPSNPNLCPGSILDNSSCNSNAFVSNVETNVVCDRSLFERQEQLLREFVQLQNRQMLELRSELAKLGKPNQEDVCSNIGKVKDNSASPKFSEFPSKVACDLPTKIDNQLIANHHNDTTIKEVVTPRVDLQLPKVELSFFDGHPISYWKFIRQFETYVESKVVEEEQCLLYLIHYCKGKARAAIEECVILPPSIGYRRAKGILRRLFGQPHVVAREMLDNLVKGPTVDYSNSESLSNLAIRMENCAIALEQMDYTSDLNSLNTLEMVVKLLPQFLQLKWAETVDKITEDEREPTFRDLIEFVSSRARIANSRFGQLANRSKRVLPVKISCPIRKEPERIDVKRLCAVCGETHSIKHCTQFLSLPVNERWLQARKRGLCFICLGETHIANQCKLNERYSQYGCQGNHHPLLHGPASVGIPDSSLSVKNHCSITKTETTSICLGLVPVRLRSGSNEIIGYAFLDNGSDVTLIREDCVKQLGIRNVRNQLTIQTLGGRKTTTLVSQTFEVSSLNRNESLCIEQAVIVRRLPVDKTKLPTKDSIMAWPHLSDITLDYVDNGEVLLLIGCDVPEAHWVLDQRLGGRKKPYAIKTLLGWTVFGPVSSKKCNVKNVHLIHHSETVDAQLKHMYDLEFGDVHSIEKLPSSDDLAAMEIVQKGSYLSEGHFVVPLPWKRGADTGPGNYELVRRRLESLKQNLLRNTDLRERYVRCMEDTISKGYAELVPERHRELEYRPRWYLPHHGVVNPRKPGKLRVVFDCSAKYNGVSLNDLLYQGPDTTANLVGILLRFRKEQIAVSADIEEMFMQVKIPKSDRGALRFLWWPKGDLSKEAAEYQMTSHPFGATSSPFCANFALIKTVQEFSESYDSYVRSAVRDNFYVDDCLISFSSVEQAKSFIRQINELMLRGGFKLRKWVLNSELVAAVFPIQDNQAQTVNMPTGYGVTHRTLGLEWDTKLDVFRFSFEPKEKPLTRRGVLSVVSSLFDPLGLVAPICLPAKQLLQKLCKTRLGWDQPLGESDVSAWKEWMEFMRQLESISVSRSIMREKTADNVEVELHVFSDASEAGYGAVAYARIISQECAPYCVLLLSKSRVTPIKHVTIPRLELAAAVLGVRLSELLNKNLPQFFCRTNFWTDSMTVLYYIKNTEKRYSTFVANRLSVIHQYSHVEQWSYVKSELNPADWTSRGITNQKDLKDWFDGPIFLREHGQQFIMGSLDIPLSDIEFKNSSVQVNVTIIEKVGFPLLSYYSDWTKLVRAAAWFRRYIDYLIIMCSNRKDCSIKLGPLSVAELEAAKRKILKLVQEDAYPVALKILRENKDMPSHINLKRLSPVLIDDLMCVGGRLSYSEFSISFKHPIILPNHHIVTEMVIRHYHKEEGHCGASQVLAAIREVYWIVKGVSEVRRVIRRCVLCRRLNARLGQQMMAPLPICRVKQGWYSFAFTGIDYFGPLFVRRGRSIEKRYGCVFTCLQSRAVHLEVAHDLSTDSFILVLIRFIGRRGKPLEIYSDNGSNFVGVISELRMYIRQWDSSKINTHLASKQIQWHFNPPSASHRGGVWERIIRSVRRLLLAITNDQVLNEETLVTYMVEVERILNNRPIVPVTSDEKDERCLTPNNLLLLRDCEGVSVEGSIQDKYRKRWKQVNYLADLFWHRWKREYLTTLQCRQKWITKHRNFKEGDVVIIATDLTKRGTWPLGVVEKCEMDKDNLVRTLKIRTKDGLVSRDIRKVCLLEGSE